MIAAEYNDFIYKLATSVIGLIDEEILSLSANKKDDEIFIKLVTNSDAPQRTTSREIERSIRDKFSNSNITFNVESISHEMFLLNDSPMLKYGIFLRSKY